MFLADFVLFSFFVTLEPTRLRSSSWESLGTPVATLPTPAPGPPCRSSLPNLEVKIRAIWLLYSNKNSLQRIVLRNQKYHNDMKWSYEQHMMDSLAHRTYLDWDPWESSPFRRTLRWRFRTRPPDHCSTARTSSMQLTSMHSLETAADCNTAWGCPCGGRRGQNTLA